MPHTTRCGTVYNQTGVPWNIVNPESGRSWGIAANQNLSFEGEVIPWAARSAEVATKAFLFNRGALSPGLGTSIFFLFQRNPAPDDIHWSPVPAAGLPPAWPGTRGASKSDLVNVRILANNTPAVDRVLS